ncbi:MAG: ATP-binding protein [Synechococcus sp.]
MSPRGQRSLAQQLTRSTGLQLILVASALGVLTYSLGRNSGLQRSEHHRATLPVIRVTEKLSSKLREPIHLNELNQAAIKADPSLLNDFDRLGRRFWRQIKSFSVDYINYGAADGSFLGLEKTANGDLLHNEDSTRFGRRQLTIFSLSNDGKRQQKQDIVPGMSATHEEAWYTDTVRAGASQWSRIYSWEDQPEVHSISYNTPIFDAKKQLLGVIGVDMVIHQLSTWLQQAWRDDVGLALLVEADGTLIASSNPAVPITVGGQNPTRRHLNDLEADLPQAFATLLKATSFKTTPQLHHIEGRAFMLKATPWGSEHNLNWVLLTAISAEEAIGQANRNLSIAIAVSLAAMASALLINRRLIQRILQPLSALQQASQGTESQIRSTTEQEPVALTYTCELDNQSGQELLELNSAIEAMVSAFNELTESLAAKEQQIRTLFEERHAQDEQTLALMSNKLKSSLEAASIAHEINQPLSIIQLTAHALLDQQNSDERGALPEPIRQHIAVLQTQSERVGHITGQIKAMLRSASGRHVRLDLRDVIQNSLMYVRSNIRVAEPWITAPDFQDKAGAAAWIEGDAIQLQIALINLLKNAIDAVRPGNGDLAPPKIVLTLKEGSDHWSIVIWDNGPGLAGNIHTDQPLATTKDSGSGLGLFIVRAAMESHNGRLELANDSRRGGTRAALVLPKADDPH